HRDDVDVRRVEVDAVEQDLPGRPGAGDLLVHAVDAADHRRLAAARWPDDRRDLVRRKGKIDTANGVVAAVVGVEVLELEVADVSPGLGVPAVVLAHGDGGTGARLILALRR